MRVAAGKEVLTINGARPRRRFCIHLAMRCPPSVAVAPLSLALGVVLHACEVKDDTRLIANYFAVVPRWDRDDVARAEVELGAVIHDHLLMSREDITQVWCLTAVGTGEGLDML
jgi:hypothetical protein